MKTFLELNSGFCRIGTAIRVRAELISLELPGRLPFYEFHQGFLPSGFYENEAGSFLCLVPFGER